MNKLRTFPMEFKVETSLVPPTFSNFIYSSSDKELVYIDFNYYDQSASTRESERLGELGMNSSPVTVTVVPVARLAISPGLARTLYQSLGEILSALESETKE